MDKTKYNSREVMVEGNRGSGTEPSVGTRYCGGERQRENISILLEVDVSKIFTSTLLYLNM